MPRSAQQLNKQRAIAAIAWMVVTFVYLAVCAENFTGLYRASGRVPAVSLRFLPDDRILYRAAVPALAAVAMDRAELLAAAARQF